MNNAALVLIHGYPFDHTLWNQVIQGIDPSIRCIAPDLPGFGNEPTCPTSPSIDFYAEFLKNRLDEMGIDQVIVAGMSMGGYVALAFAEKFREQVLGLVLISSHAGADSPETREKRWDLIRKIRSEGVQAAVDAIRPQMISDPKNADLIAEKLNIGAESSGVNGLAWALEAMAKRPDRTQILHEASFPLLIVHGENDKIIPISKIEGVARTNSAIQMTRLPNAGHATPLDAPEEVARALNTFWKEARHHPRKSVSPPTRPPIIWSPTEKGL